MTRLGKLRQDKKDDMYQPEMPPVEAGGYLIGYLFEVGPVLNLGMGATRITQQELRAWQLNMGLQLAPWEIRTLCRLSSEYLSWSQKAEKADCKAPWQSPETAVIVSTGMRDSIRAMAGL